MDTLWTILKRFRQPTDSDAQWAASLGVGRWLISDQKRNIKPARTTLAKIASKTGVSFFELCRAASYEVRHCEGPDCHTEFLPASRSQRFCSRPCAGRDRRPPVESWLRQWSDNVGSPVTGKHYLSNVLTILRQTSKSLEALTREDLASYIDSGRARGIKDETISGRLYILDYLYVYALANGLVERVDNPLDEGIDARCACRSDCSAIMPLKVYHRIKGVPRWAWGHYQGLPESVRTKKSIAAQSRSRRQRVLSLESTVQVRRLYEEGKSTREISEEVGIPKETVKSRLRLLGIRLERGRLPADHGQRISRAQQGKQNPYKKKTWDRAKQAVGTLTEALVAWATLPRTQSLKLRRVHSDHAVLRFRKKSGIPPEGFGNLQELLTWALANLFPPSMRGSSALEVEEAIKAAESIYAALGLNDITRSMTRKHSLPFRWWSETALIIAVGPHSLEVNEDQVAAALLHHGFGSAGLCAALNVTRRKANSLYYKLKMKPGAQVLRSTAPAPATVR